MDLHLSTDGNPASSGTWHIAATLLAKLNLAGYQNAVPALRELAVVNGTETTAQGLELRIESAPPFLKPKVWRIEQIEAGGRYRLTDLDLALDGALLSRLTEAEPAKVTLARARRGTVATIAWPPGATCVVHLKPQSHHHEQLLD